VLETHIEKKTSEETETAKKTEDLTSTKEEEVEEKKVEEPQGWFTSLFGRKKK